MYYKKQSRLKERSFDEVEESISRDEWVLSEEEKSSISREECV